MPQIQLVEVLDVTSKDDKFPPENMIRKCASKWLCKKGEVNRSMSATFKLSKPTSIGRVNVGNASSASVDVLVSRGDCQDFKELVAPIIFRTESDCRNGEKKQGVMMLSAGQIKEDVRHEKWDVIRVVCYQPYRRPEDEQFGLSFLYIYDAPVQSSPVVNNLERFKESAIRSSLTGRKEVAFSSSMTRAQKMIAASKTSPVDPKSSPTHTAKDGMDDDIFKATVISFLDSNANVISSKLPSEAKTELHQKLQSIMARKFNIHENRTYNHIFRNYLSSYKEKLPSGILTPRTSNHQISTSPGNRKIVDTKSLLKVNEPFNNFNTQTVYWAEVVHNRTMKDGPVSYIGRNGKENTPYLLEKNGLTNMEKIFDEPCSPVLNSDKKMCLDKTQQEKFSPRDGWKSRNEVDQCDSRDCSPDTWLKRKSDSSERLLSSNKKRPRESVSAEEICNEPSVVNRVTPPGGWLLNGCGLPKKKFASPEEKKQDPSKFPFRVSPPPPPDRPASPLPLVDDIDQPSTSSRETVAERNIRLDLERKLAERSPPERVVQRTSAGKVKGPFCTKGMNTNDSPLRRLSICDENEEVGSPQARRKLSFVRQNGHDGEDLVECPVCKYYFENCDINKHLDDCVPSPLKKADDGDNDDEMACPICGQWQPKETVAAHADECAQKRYGA